VTRYDAIRRQLADIERDHERQLAQREMQIRLLCGYRDELEDHVDIAAGMIAHRDDIDKDAAVELIAYQYEVRQAARKVAVT